MKTRRRTNFGSLESSCLLTKSGQLIPTLLFGASLFLAWLPSQINWFPVANLECSLCAMFFFCFFCFFLSSSSPHFQTHKYSPSSLRGINQRQRCQVFTQLCVCISFYTWAWFIFVSVPLMLRHVSYFIRLRVDSWEASSLWQASGWPTLPVPGLPLWFGSLLRHRGLCFVLFFFFFLWSLPRK